MIEDYCIQVNGHAFVYGCTSGKNGEYREVTREEFAHIKGCDDCRSRVSNALREYSVGNKSFDHARFFQTLAEIEEQDR